MTFFSISTISMLVGQNHQRVVQTRRIHPNLVVADSFEHQDDFLRGRKHEEGNEDDHKNLSCRVPARGKAAGTGNRDLPGPSAGYRSRSPRPIATGAATSKFLHREPIKNHSIGGLPE
jgi:hypothetical protein